MYERHLHGISLFDSVYRTAICLVCMGCHAHITCRQFQKGRPQGEGVNRTN